MVGPVDAQGEAEPVEEVTDHPGDVGGTVLQEGDAVGHGIPSCPAPGGVRTVRSERPVAGARWPPQVSPSSGHSSRASREVAAGQLPRKGEGLADLDGRHAVVGRHRHQGQPEAVPGRLEHRHGLAHRAADGPSDVGFEDVGGPAGQQTGHDPVVGREVVGQDRGQTDGGVPPGGEGLDGGHLVDGQGPGVAVEAGGPADLVPSQFVLERTAQTGGDVTVGESGQGEPADHVPPDGRRLLRVGEPVDGAEAPGRVPEGRLRPRLHRPFAPHCASVTPHVRSSGRPPCVVRPLHSGRQRCGLSVSEATLPGVDLE